jgi:hypothetical protein
VYSFSVGEPGALLQPSDERLILSSSSSGCEDGARSAPDDGTVLRRFDGGASRSESVCAMSTLGRDEGIAVLSWSSLSDSAEGGSERSEDAGESAMAVKMYLS